MKYLASILILIVIALGVIAVRLAEVKNILIGTQGNNQLLITSQQALISSNQHLQEEIAALRKQIVELQDKVVKR